jgi:predicted TIM-barrel fold metal-dependent hydrolase
MAMRIVDCHVHSRGPVDAAATVKAMDANGVDRLLVLSANERTSLAKTRQNLQATAALCRASGGRIDGLAWITPTIEGSVGLAEVALTEMGFVGIKIIPDHFFVYEERLAPFWKRLDELSASVLFHSGILYGFEDGSRFCKPMYLETMMHYPKIRFAMAHISWPWCEECLAVMGHMRHVHKSQPGHPYQSYIDTTPGTPRHIRKQALANAIDFCGVERMLFGTDDSLPSDLSFQKRILEMDLGLYAELGLSPSQQQQILAGTADELFPPRS